MALTFLSGLHANLLQVKGDQLSASQSGVRSDMTCVHIAHRHLHIGCVDCDDIHPLGASKALTGLMGPSGS